ncbi:ribosome biogenesis factor YjgA [Salicola sp. Rm-C-2C1-2]|uniref:ribosome biogenesis factor YjgA n=1 Tax=Salicola sp. Rm-C-2C1-2 TaxID=3141321 RepID=UPI0032E44EB2
MSDADTPGEPQDELPTKSQAKREMQELRDLASALSGLPEERIHQLPASPAFIEQLLVIRTLADGEPQRRQIHYLGRQILEEDEQALRRAVAGQTAGTTEHTRRLHMAERWRERLIHEGKPALTEFMGRYPQSDGQHLRQLIRNAANQSGNGDRNSPRRRLFRYLRERIDEGEQV